MSIAFVMKFESKVAVKTMIYKNYDGTTNRFIKKEYSLRKIFIAIYCVLMIYGSYLYITREISTNLFNVGTKLTGSSEEHLPIIPFNFHILSLELTLNEFSGISVLGIDPIVTDIIVKASQYFFGGWVFLYMLSFMKQNHNFNYL